MLEPQSSSFSQDTSEASLNTSSTAANQALSQLVRKLSSVHLKLHTLNKTTSGTTNHAYREHLQLKTRIEARLEPTRNYPESTIHLLAKYFAGKATQAERTQLSAELLFPNNASIQATWNEMSNTDIKVDLLKLLNAHSLFPNSTPAATLWLKYSTNKESLTLEEHLSLYLFRSNSDTNQSRGLTNQVKKALQIFEKKQLPETVLIPLLSREIPNFVRSELSTSAIASSDSELAKLFSISVESVTNILADPHTGLTESENRLRSEKLILQTQLLNEPFVTNIIATVRQLVAIENDLQRSGIIITLSKSEQLADLFKCTTAEMDHYLHFLHEKDLEYRKNNLPDSSRIRCEKNILALVNTAKAHGSFYSYQQLSAQTQSSPVMVYHLLKATLSPQEWEQQKLHSDLPAEGRSALERLRNFVNQEVSCLLDGGCYSISTDEELSVMFNCSSETIYAALSPTNATGLSERFFRVREFALALRQPLSPATRALRSHLADEVRERLVKNGSTVTSKKSVTTKESSWRPIHLNGHNFSSFEEAACGCLLQKYVPGFILEDGRTLQIRVNGRSIDFKVGDYFVEYHPIQLYWTANGRGSFASRDEYLEFQKIREEISNGNDAVRSAFSARVQSELRNTYYEQRQSIINSSEHAGSHLVLIDSAESLYYFVSQGGHRLPAFPTFEKEFKHLVAIARARNKK